MSNSQSQGWVAVRNWFGHGRIIDYVYESILSQKMNSIELANSLNEARDDEILKDESVIYKFIEREIKDQSLIPTEEVKDILKMLEDRRQAYNRNYTTVIAGIIGGVLGASLTFFLGDHTYPKSPPSIPALTAPQSETPQKN
jgi:hypothetical protein